MSIFDEVNSWEKTEGANIFSSILNVSEPVILDYGCGAGIILLLRHMHLIRNAKSMLWIQISSALIM